MNSQDDESQQLAASRLQRVKDASAYVVTVGTQHNRDASISPTLQAEVEHAERGDRLFSASMGRLSHPNAGRTKVRKTEPV